MEKTGGRSRIERKATKQENCDLFRWDSFTKGTFVSITHLTCLLIYTCFRLCVCVRHIPVKLDGFRLQFA